MSKKAKIISETTPRAHRNQTTALAQTSQQSKYVVTSKTGNSILHRMCLYIRNGRFQTTLWSLGLSGCH